MNLDFSSIKGTAKIASAVALFSCATFFQARAATIELPLYGFQIDALDAASTTALQLFSRQPYTGLIKGLIPWARMRRICVESMIRKAADQWNREPGVLAQLNAFAATAQFGLPA